MLPPDLLQQEEKEELDVQIKLGQSSSATESEEMARNLVWQSSNSRANKCVAEQQQSREQEHAEPASKFYVLNLEHRTTLLMLQVMFASAPPKLRVKDSLSIACDHKTPVCKRT